MKPFLAALWLTVGCGVVSPAAAQDWVEPMRQVHARFRGTNGTLAHFGDSITVTMAYWTPLAATPRNPGRAARAHALVKGYLKPEGWRGGKGPDFGNNGSMTIRWAHQNVDRWLQRMNPEAVVILFGSNDVGQMRVEEYERTTREVVRRCLTNGTIPILTTMPPRSRRMDESWQFVEAVRTVAREERVPLIHYFAEILSRRPEDWDGSLPQFKEAPGDEYQVPTLVARDGVHPSNPAKYVNDFSDEALRTNGFSLRNHATLLAYAEVIEKVLARPSN